MLSLTGQIGQIFIVTKNTGSQTSRLGSLRFAGETPASQDRGRLACWRLYSTAGERGLRSQPPFYLPCGKVQARRPRSVGLACISRSRASC
ncbi:MAG: hypothetical protein LBP59_05420 [Planctomycetaceae bacterium]|nr:hypothetical protein [Planctomycetaceae bacterium]